MPNVHHVIFKAFDPCAKGVFPAGYKPTHPSIPVFVPVCECGERLCAYAMTFESAMAVHAEHVTSKI